MTWLISSWQYHVYIYKTNYGGWVKQLIGTCQILLRNQLQNIDNFKKPLVDSLKQGFVAFVAFLVILGILNYFTSIVHARSVKMISILDIATALVGFVLVFGGKFLESLHGKR